MDEHSRAVSRVPIPPKPDAADGDLSIGYVEFDIERVAAVYCNLVRAHRPDLHVATWRSADLARWVVASAQKLASSVTFQIGAYMDEARKAEQIEQRLEERANRPPPPARELLLKVQPQTARIKQSWRGSVAAHYARRLQESASEVLGPGRAKLDVGERELEDDHELTFLEFIAVARERGEAAAIDDIVRWLREKVRTGPKELDRMPILRSYALTARAIGEFRTRWTQGHTEDDRDLPLVAALRSAGYDHRTIAEQSAKLDKSIARKIVAKQFKTTPETIKKMWKERGSI